MLNKKIVISSLIGITMLPAVAVAGSKAGGKIGVGIQSSWPSYGLSAKYDMNEDITLQGIVGALGTVTNFGGRVLYKFKKEPKYNFYAFGGVSMYKWSNAFYDDSVVGFNAGGGLEYDLSKEFSGTPITISGEVGAALVSFDHYDAFSSFGLGVGIHYWLDK